MRLPQNTSPLQAHLDALATHLGVDAKDLRRAIVLMRTGRGDLVQEVIDRRLDLRRALKMARARS